MEIVREYIDASILMKIITLPEAFKNQRLEIIVLPTEDTKKNKKGEEIQAAIQSLIGAIPDDGLSLEDYREERLKKYEIID